MKCKPLSYCDAILSPEFLRSGDWSRSSWREHSLASKHFILRNLGDLLDLYLVELSVVEYFGKNPLSPGAYLYQDEATMNAP